MNPSCKPVLCKKALNNVSGRFPYKWDLNIYRGCRHSCKYCFAVYSHKYINSPDYFGEIFVKTNIAEQLEKDLRSRRCKGEIINIGGITDSYQPCEKDFKLMPEILRLLIKYKNPAIISTKSDLILRDYGLIDELSKITYVNIACTITVSDEKLQKKVEPYGASPQRRFTVLKEFSKTNASTGLHIMPVIPFLGDSPENLENLFCAAKDAGADYALTQILNLRGLTKKIFTEFINKEFPLYKQAFASLYKGAYVPKEYKQATYKVINSLRKKYCVPADYTRPLKEKIKKSFDPQLDLFEKTD